MENKDDAKKRLAKGCGFSALTAAVIAMLVFMTVCVITYIVPRQYEARLAYAGASDAPKATVYGELVENLRLERRWGVSHDDAINEIDRSFSFSGDELLGKQLIVLRTDKDEAAELANMWGGVTGVEMKQRAEGSLTPAYPDIRKNLAGGLLAAIALALPPAGIVLWLTLARAKP